MKDLKPQFDFNDILIVPSTKTHISSRYKDIILPRQLPLFTAPMDTVVDTKNMFDFIENGIGVTLPRTIKRDDYHLVPKGVFVSMGFEDLDFELKTSLRNLPMELSIVIDVANGHMQKIFDYCREIKRIRPDIILMVGNIGNPEAYDWYARGNCVDYIRVGIGNGCFARGSRILMGNGFYKNIEDVCCGDEIITMNGNVAKVKRLINRGNKHVINVKTSMSPKTTRVTPKHNYYVGNYKKGNIRKYGYSKSINNYDWSEINSYDENLTPLFPKSIKFNIPNSFNYNLLDFAIKKRTATKYKTEINSNYNIGYIFGTFLGDGNSRIRVQKRINKNGTGYKKSTIGSIHWSFGVNEIGVVNKLKKCLFDEFGLTTKEKSTKNIIKVSLYCKPLAHLLFEFGKRTEKYLPEKYFVNNTRYLIGLFDGLIDSDGNNDDGRISFHNTSLKLIELYNIIQYLLNDSLPNSRTRESNNSQLIKNSNISYSSRNLKSPEKRNTTDNKYIINKIVDIIDNKKNVEVFDLEIDDDSHSFIADNCIVHNSGCLTTKQSGVGYPMASLIHETYLVKQRFIESNNIDIKNQNTILHTKPVDIIPAIVADGGMKDHSDIIKSLALGADYVMIGSIFNKAFESCAQNYLYGIKINKGMARYFFKKGRPVKKYFRGMSTKGAQKAMGNTSFKTSEGVIRFRKVEYHLSGWVENFEHYLRNAMSYSNSRDLSEFVGKTDICQITTRAYDRFNK